MEVKSLTGSATRIISNAQQKLDNAAQTIASLATQNDEVGGTQNIPANQAFKPILSMKEAEQDTYIGIKLLKAQNKMLGSLLSVKV